MADKKLMIDTSILIDYFRKSNKRKTIDKPDLFIAATAVVHELTFDTLNTKHFIDIKNLDLLL